MQSSSAQEISAMAQDPGTGNAISPLSPPPFTRQPGSKILKVKEGESINAAARESINTAAAGTTPANAGGLEVPEANMPPPPPPSPAGVQGAPSTLEAESINKYIKRANESEIPPEEAEAVKVNMPSSPAGASVNTETSAESTEQVAAAAKPETPAESIVPAASAVAPAEAEAEATAPAEVKIGNLLQVDQLKGSKSVEKTGEKTGAAPGAAEAEAAATFNQFTKAEMNNPSNLPALAPSLLPGTATTTTTESYPTTVTIVKNIKQLDNVLNQPQVKSHIVLHQKNAQNIVDNLKKSSCTNSSSSSSTTNTPKKPKRSKFRLGTAGSPKPFPPIHQPNPLVSMSESSVGGKPKPKKRSMKRKKPKKKGAAARKTQMKIKQKKTRNKIKKQMRKTKRKR